MASKKYKNFEKDFPHWNICEECALKKGAKWPPGEGIGITVMGGICNYCGENRTLIPLRDFQWPEYRRREIFD